MGLLVSVGMVVGFLSGLLGVGGGFLMTPILMMIGIPPIVAAASDTNAIVATSASGVAAHFRLNNVDFKMGGYLPARWPVRFRDRRTGREDTEGARECGLAD